MIKLRGNTIAAMLIETYEHAYKRGVANGSAGADDRVRESTKALVEENNKLKSELKQILYLGQEGVTKRLHESALKEIVHLLLKGGVL